MPLLRYLGRAAAWSVALCLGWRIAEPVTRPILIGFTQLFLALFHASQSIAQKPPHLGAVLFLALFLAARPRGKRALALGVAGTLACLAAQGLTTAVLVAAQDERRVAVRLGRDIAIALDKVIPLAAALTLVPRTQRRPPPRTQRPAPKS
jgi:hypothetical protein